ncbi:isocitrate/isopropylmalate family dehydrogenase, partial [Vibrio cholerae]|uniref:isocitrate/isopropylmalate family dehydrogenase n=1 Tax=Vibrio cholerae TaxID=666 RepID=UPI001A2FE360
APISWIERKAGIAAIDEGKDVLPDDTVAAIRAHGVALEGPCTTPVGGGFTSVNVKLRKTLDLYAAVRPVRNLSGVASRYENVDLVVVR